MLDQDKKYFDFITKTIFYNLDENVNCCIMAYGPDNSGKSFYNIYIRENYFWRYKSGGLLIF